jgi:hypothetical protein
VFVPRLIRHVTSVPRLGMGKVDYVQMTKLVELDA